MNRNHHANTHRSPSTLDLFGEVHPDVQQHTSAQTLTATRLRLPVPVFSLRLVRERDHETDLVHTPADAARVCCELLAGFDREVFLALALSTASRVIGAHLCHTGTVDASVASPREVFKFCLLVNARSVIVAHNHPSGNLEPSRADVAVSIRLKKAGENLDIPLVDSLVVGFSGRYTSLVERGLI
jgi:DNA repair protein RadC